MNIISTRDFKGNFFSVLETTDKSQVAVMTIAPGKDSGPEETHSGDQIVYVIEGEARITIDNEEGKAKKGDLVVIPAGAAHHIYNDGKDDLFFLTLYTPPQY